MGLEERIAKLEALLEKKTVEYDREITRAQAAVEIQSVMGRYAFYYTAQRFDLMDSLWAKAEDSSYDVGGGAELINKGDDPDHRITGVSKIGLFRIHSLSTPVIAVAADGQTARTTWISPGISTDVVNGKSDCSWDWIKYGVDFIKEDGEWKLWHVAAYGLFHTDYYRSWGDSPARPLKREMPPEFKKQFADRKDFVPVERDDWTYATDRSPVLDPVPPLPYNTWDEVAPGYRTWK